MPAPTPQPLLGPSCMSSTSGPLHAPFPSPTRPTWGPPQCLLHSSPPRVPDTTPSPQLAAPPRSPSDSVLSLHPLVGSSSPLFISCPPADPRPTAVCCTPRAKTHPVPVGLCHVSTKQPGPATVGGAQVGKAAVLEPPCHPASPRLGIPTCPSFLSQQTADHSPCRGLRRLTAAAAPVALGLCAWPLRCSVPSALQPTPALLLAL